MSKKDDPHHKLLSKRIRQQKDELIRHNCIALTLREMELIDELANALLDYLEYGAWEYAEDPKPELSRYPLNVRLHVNYEVAKVARNMYMAFGIKLSKHHDRHKIMAMDDVEWDKLMDVSEE